MCNVIRFMTASLAVILCISISTQTVEAKKKRLKDDILKEAIKLGKDRESKLSGEKAMENDAFLSAWESFVGKLDETYAGHEVKLKAFGSDVRFRKGFAHLMYIALRSQTRGVELKPTAQEVVGRHPFLQELMLQGSCYTGGDPFPKKVTELMEANPGIPFLLAEHLESWDGKYQKKFKKVYPKAN